MKHIIACLLSLLFASSSYAYSIDWANTSRLSSGPFGDVKYHSFNDGSVTYFHDQSPDVNSTMRGIFRVDTGESLTPHTNLVFDRNVSFSSSVWSGKSLGNVDFYKETKINIYDITDNLQISNYSSYQLFYHTLGLSEDLSLSDNLEISLINGHEYIFQIYDTIGAPTQSFRDQLTGMIGSTEEHVQLGWDLKSQVVNFSHSPAPEPSTLLLFGVGLAGLAAAGRKKRN